MFVTIKNNKRAFLVSEASKISGPVIPTERNDKESQKTAEQEIFSGKAGSPAKSRGLSKKLSDLEKRVTERKYYCNEMS